eukprot:scaffold18285_cov35-Tisochrysis_lutea.AAC.5
MGHSAVAPVLRRAPNDVLPILGTQIETVHDHTHPGSGCRGGAHRRDDERCRRPHADDAARQLNPPRKRTARRHDTSFIFYQKYK